ncbi:MAG: hypothetical protein IT249_06900 [Chitinophagaceae bacterium]|nr:hypothetical protein [Chitinophagaceae bacterium]
MERIVIQVADDVAQKWRETPEKVKERLSELFEQQIDTVAHKIRVMEFQTFLDKIGTEAQANGLTEEILQELLKEDE